jgi:hypothetical protein
MSKCKILPWPFYTVYTSSQPALHPITHLSDEFWQEERHGIFGMEQQALRGCEGD